MSWESFQNNIKNEVRNLKSDCERAGEIQLEILHDILGKNISLEDFRKKIPLKTYADYTTSIQTASKTGKALLPNDKILAFEITSGTNAAAKLIPMTKNSLAAMRYAILPWFDDLLKTFPTITKGRAFLAISPSMRPITQTPSGHKIGLPDTAYLGDENAICLRNCLIPPPDIDPKSDLIIWQKEMLKQLILAEDLSFISIWSPSYLTALIKTAEAILPEIQAVLPPSRAKMLEKALKEYDLSLLWPKLAVISCWTEGTAARYLPALQSYFPKTPFQGKGLLATEAAITLPLNGFIAPILAPRAAFFEFIDDNNQAHLCHQLKIGQTYRLIITSYNGLLRYELGDKVRVEAYHKEAPMLSFLGRTGLIVDICGEKMSEDFVLTAIETLQNKTIILAPSPNPHPQYRLFMDKSDISKDTAPDIAKHIDKNLCQNPHYAHARKIGQMKPLEIWAIPHLEAQYSALLAKKGTPLSVLKMPVLNQHDNLAKIFKNAEYITTSHQELML